MTHWLLTGETPANFTAGASAVLQDPLASSSKVTLVDQDLGGEEALAHLKAGMHVRQMRMHWHDAVDFTLTGDLVMKKFGLSDVSTERQLESTYDLPEYEQIDSDATLLAGEINRVLSSLYEVLGGDAQKDLFQEAV